MADETYDGAIGIDLGMAHIKNQHAPDELVR
jgi:hypothetical protein